MKKSKSSHQWLREHEDDEFVQRARAEGYQSRAVYKLLEIKEKFKILKAGDCVVDLGATPGGWSQVAAKAVGDKGRVIASDILEMDPIEGVTFIQGDFTELEPFDEIMEAIDGNPVDLVISDMAPNLSGNKSIDQPAVIYLAELAVDLAGKVLAADGVFIAKLFQGEGFDQFVQSVRKRFNKVSITKPEASRSRSREVYLVAKGLKAI